MKTVAGKNKCARWFVVVFLLSNALFVNYSSGQDHNFLSLNSQAFILSKQPCVIHSVGYFEWGFVDENNNCQGQYFAPGVYYEPNRELLDKIYWTEVIGYEPFMSCSLSHDNKYVNCIGFEPFSCLLKSGNQHMNCMGDECPCLCLGRFENDELSFGHLASSEYGNKICASGTQSSASYYLALLADQDKISTYSVLLESRQYWGRKAHQIGRVLYGTAFIFAFHTFIKASLGINIAWEIGDIVTSTSSVVYSSFAFVNHTTLSGWPLVFKILNDLIHFRIKISKS